MASDPRAGQRAYLEIKNAILSGELRLRQRLDIDALARWLGASATPVRQALAILAVERLVLAHSSRGYYVAFWSETELRTLYQWRGQLARLAAESFEFNGAAASAIGGHADRYNALMRQLEAGANEELRRAAAAADDRLRVAVVAESQVFEDAFDQLTAIAMAMAAADRPVIQQKLDCYFAQRVAQAAQIRARASVSALPRNGD
jgi:DNA-binding GntR family transcriptional regulator